MKKMKEESRKLLIYSAAAYSICALLETLFALILGKVVDDAVNGDMKQLICHAFMNIGIILISLLFYWIAIKLRRAYVRGNILSIKRRIMMSLYSRGLNIYSKKPNSYYINLLSYDVDMIEENYFLYRPLFVFCVAEFIFSFGALLLISWKALLSFAVLFLIPLIIPQLFAGMIKKRSEKVSEGNEHFIFEVKEQIQGMEEIVGNLSVSTFLKKFAEVNNVQQRNKESAGTGQNFVNELSASCGAISQLGCMAVGAALVIYGDMSVGALIASVQLLNSIFGPINKIAEISAKKESAKPIIEKLLPEMEQGQEAISGAVSKISGDIEYDNVEVWYEMGKPVIKKFSHRFKEGKTYAVIGDSGTGKTTLFKCLLKLHMDFSGKIRIGNREIENLSEEEIYDFVGYVPQNAYLFNETIENNITMSGAYSEKEIYDVIKKVNLEKLIEENRGKLGDLGQEISGGEKQRIILARALIRKPQVLLFDEPTTALDPGTRDSINEMIFSLTEYTRIVITHDRRPEYLVQFDEVIEI